MISSLSIQSLLPIYLSVVVLRFSVLLSSPDGSQAYCNSLFSPDMMSRPQLPSIHCLPCNRVSNFPAHDNLHHNDRNLTNKLGHLKPYRADQNRMLMSPLYLRVIRRTSRFPLVVYPPCPSFDSSRSRSILLNRSLYH